MWSHDIDIFIKYNESVNSCATTWFEGINATSNTKSNVTINASTKTLITSINDTFGDSISSWTNLSCSAANSTLILPYFCFSSMCSDCVRTTDFETNCEWVE